MLTHEVSVAFKPQTTVTALAVSKDGNLLAWSEKNGLINLSIDGNKPNSVSIEGIAKGLFFQNINLIIGDDNFGLKCLDKQCELIWECEIPGGLSLIEKCQDFIAVVDNLGRLSIVDYNGKIINNNLEFTSIIKLLSSKNCVIVVQEDGSVHCFDGKQVIWNRPSRGEVGEAITAVGIDSFENLIIGREGYALVPGDEEALEIEIWDVYQNKLILRDEIKNRLIVTASNSTDTYLGFDDGAIYSLERLDDGKYNLSDKIFDCKYPVKTLNITNDAVVAGSWFYLHGVTSSGDNWMVEHQGIIQYSAYCIAKNTFYFAGDDQNDYTGIEPIGVIDLSLKLLEKDKAELTLWFEFSEQNDKLSAEEIYSDDDKLESLISIEEQSQLKFHGDDLNNLLTALEGDNEKLIDDGNNEKLVGDNLLQELLDEVQITDFPVANAGEDCVYNCGDENHSIVVLDSGNTTGDKSKIVSYSWIDDTGKEISNLPKLRVKLARGKYRFELRIIDIDGNSTLDSIQVEVI